MDRISPRRLPAALARKVSRRAVLQTIGLAGASAAFLSAPGPRSLAAVQPEVPPPEWFETDSVCPNDATCGRHGQLIVGEGPIYLSHLPMFMFDAPANHPHHYQVLLDVSFPADAHAAYLADRKKTGAPLYTLQPEETFRMLDLIMPAQSQTPVQTLTGTIIRGHWERSSEPQPFGITFGEVQKDVPVTVERVTYAHEFSFHPQPLDRLEYVLFGEGENLFLAHRITAAPDFDQILPITIAAGAFIDAQLQNGIVLGIPERANSVVERLRAGDQVSGAARDAATGVAVTVQDPGNGGAPEGIQITAGGEMYFEEGELRFPLKNSDFAATDAEIEAGFGFP